MMRRCFRYFKFIHFSWLVASDLPVYLVTNSVAMCYFVQVVTHSKPSVLYSKTKRALALQFSLTTSHQLRLLQKNNKNILTLLLVTQGIKNCPFRTKLE